MVKIKFCILAFAFTITGTLLNFNVTLIQWAKTTYGNGKNGF